MTSVKVTLAAGFKLKQFSFNQNSPYLLYFSVHLIISPLNYRRCRLVKITYITPIQTRETRGIWNVNFIRLLWIFELNHKRRAITAYARVWTCEMCSSKLAGFTILNLICRQCATVKSSSAKPAAGNCHRIHYMQNKCNEKPIWIQVNIFYSNAQQCVQIFTFHIGRHCVLSRHKSLCMN